MAKVLETLNPMLTLPFGNGHIGIDIVGNQNGWGAIDDLLAVEAGTIEAIETRCNKVYSDVNQAIREWGHSYGNYVLINHGIINGHEYKTRYAHEMYGSNNLLYVGQKLHKGSGLGSMGNTGCTFGAHLHFELIRDGVNIDPYPLVFEGKEIKDLDKPVEVPKEEPVEMPIEEPKEEEPTTTPTEIETPQEEPKNEEIEQIIEPINQDKKNPFIEFIKWIIRLIFRKKD